MFSLVKAASILTLLCVVGAAQTQARRKYEGRAAPSKIRRQLAELNKHFTYKGRPVHPLAVQELASGVADPLPGPIAIDVEGTYDSNRYFGEYAEKEGRVLIELKTDGTSQGWFGYEYLGRLANGFHVLRTFDNGGGTGVFQNLLLIKCAVDYEYGGEGERRNRLVMTRMGEILLGDRYSGRTKLQSDRNVITIGADNRYFDQDRVIRIR